MEAIAKDMNMQENKLDMESLFSCLDKGIADMEVMRMHTVDEAFQIVRDRMNPDAAASLYTNLNREVKNIGDFPLKYADSGMKYKGYVIHKKTFQSYLIFYIVSDEKQMVYVLRILKNVMNWHRIMKEAKIYHF